MNMNFFRNFATMKHPAKTDVAVLLLFFTRSDTFRQVFEAVRQARPSRLFLYQDGPRNEADRKGIEACREICSDEHIDWQCDVRRNYLDHNEGCDPSGFRSHRWAFSLADKVVVLEDDVVPSASFIPFCKEMLDRYERDERVTMIAGFNTDEVTPDVPDDYFFTSFQSIWGWASWRRVANRWDSRYEFLNDDYAMRQLQAVARQRGYRHDMLRMFNDHCQSGKEYFETIYWADQILQSGLTIMPTKNLVSNIGMTADSTHFSAQLDTMPRRLRRIFTMQRYELQFPLRHPRYVIENVAYKERRYKVLGWNHPWTKVCYALEELWLNIRHGQWATIGKALKKRLSKWTGTFRHA